MDREFTTRPNHPTLCPYNRAYWRDASCKLAVHFALLLGPLSTTWVMAARTGDQSGAYWHSGRLQPDGSIEGQTLSEGRNFLMTWRAVKK
jgi:hypothetical protein